MGASTIVMHPHSSRHLIDLLRSMLKRDESEVHSFIPSTKPPHKPRGRRLARIKTLTCGGSRDGLASLAPIRESRGKYVSM